MPPSQYLWDENVSRVIARVERINAGKTSPNMHSVCLKHSRHSRWYLSPASEIRGSLVDEHLQETVPSAWWEDTGDVAQMGERWPSIPEAPDKPGVVVHAANPSNSAPPWEVEAGQSEVHG